MSEVSEASKNLRNFCASFRYASDLLKSIDILEETVRSQGKVNDAIDQARKRLETLEGSYLGRRAEIEADISDRQSKLAQVKAECAGETNKLTAELEDFKKNVKKQEEQLNEHFKGVKEETEARETALRASIADLESQYSDSVNKVKAFKNTLSLLNG